MSLQSKENSQQNRETTYKEIKNRKTAYKKTVSRIEKQPIRKQSTEQKQPTKKQLTEQKQPARKQSAEQRNNLQNERKLLETIWHMSDIPECVRNPNSSTTQKTPL